MGWTRTVAPFGTLHRIARGRVSKGRSIVAAAAAVVVAAGLSAPDCAADSHDPTSGIFGCPDEIGLGTTTCGEAGGPDELGVAGESRRSTGARSDTMHCDVPADPAPASAESTPSGGNSALSRDEPGSMPVLGGSGGEGPVTGARSSRRAVQRGAEGSIEASDDAFEPEPVPDRDRRAEPRLTSRKAEAPAPVVAADEKGDADRRGDSRPSRRSEVEAPRQPAADDEEAVNPAWAFALRNISRLLDL